VCVTALRWLLLTLPPLPQTFSVEALLDGRIDVLSLLHYLHEKQATGVRDLLVNMLYDLQPQEIDAILPQLVHLSDRSLGKGASAHTNLPLLMEHQRPLTRRPALSRCAVCA